MKTIKKIFPLIITFFMGCTHSNFQTRRELKNEIDVMSNEIDFMCAKWKEEQLQNIYEYIGNKKFRRTINVYYLSVRIERSYIKECRKYFAEYTKRAKAKAVFYEAYPNGEICEDE